MTPPRPKYAAGCYFGCGKRAAKGHLFCTKSCAAAWAEEMAQGNGDEWCPFCADWKATHFDSELLQCNHYRSGIKRGGDTFVDQDKMDRMSAEMEQAEQEHYERGTDNTGSDI